MTEYSIKEIFDKYIKKTPEFIKNNYQRGVEYFVRDGKGYFTEAGLQLYMETYKLNELQFKIYRMYLEGKNIVILGAAGTGKSKLIKKMKDAVLCATTGISAYNIGGMTIHSFMGMGTGEADVDTLIKKIKKKERNVTRLRSVKTLIIDEMSMLSSELFDKINIIFQSIRNDSSFFGGIQIILSGDLLQLLPVKGSLIINNVDFNKNFNVVTLEENFRQKSDPVFINLLNRLRVGKYTKEDLSIIKSKINYNKLGYLNLVPNNNSAKIINENNLKNLEGKIYKYEMTVDGNDEFLINELKNQFSAKNLDKLEFKIGAQVMLIKNLNVKKGLVNGAIGVIVDITSYPVVQFKEEELLIEPCIWELNLGNSKAHCTQVPLILAYALTIHKSQSLTIENAVLDLGSCFLDAQVYVAISRLKNLDGLYIKSFDPKKIKANKNVLKYLGL